MTFLEPPGTPIDKPLPLLASTTDAPPSFPRSNTTPLWPRTASMESLSSSRSNRQSHAMGSAPMLKKRHSTYVLSQPQDRTMAPVPGVTPQRPLRNPARATTSLPGAHPKPKAISRPSTATGTREEVTPWELFPVPDPDAGPSAQLGGSSSPISVHARPSLTTGTVADVTPWELYPVRDPTGRSALITGLVEEVTPWELHPVPVSVPLRSTLSTGPVEEITPWELFPSPTYDESPSSATVNEKHSRSSPRVSTSSSNQSKSLAGLAHIRRRKSTSAKAIKARSNTLPGPSGRAAAVSGSGTIHASSSSKSKSTPPSKSAPTTPKLSHKTSTYPEVPPLIALPPAATNQHLPAVLHANLKFSTADRTIMEELKRNIRAREAQFIIKGMGATVGPDICCPGKKHHAYPPEEAPYPRNYEREVIDLDVWETSFCQDICESLTWHVFKTPPSKVLDLGCGTGTWILNCARSWKDSQFVGLDLVPLQPDLQYVGSSDLAARITWVHSNFLDGLPFPNDEFDFVHVKRIALGVPEDKWDSLFEEITRVMKPGGAFEMLEEDLFFPGKLLDDDSESESESDSEHRSSRHFSGRSTISHHHETVPDPSQITTSLWSEDGLPTTPTTTTTTTTTAFPRTPSRSNSPISPVVFNQQSEEDEAQELLAQVIIDYAVPSQVQKSDDTAEVPDTTPLTPSIRPQLQLSTPYGNRGQLSQPLKSKFTASAVSLIMSSVGSAAPPDSIFETAAEMKAKPRPRGYSLSASQHVSAKPSLSSTNEDFPKVPPLPLPKSTPLLLRTTPQPPVNPRDHSLLEAIYTQMLGSRFINLSPLALLGNSLSLYFKDVRTHPPIQHAFPPASTKVARPHRTKEKTTSLPETEYPTSDSDDARDAILPSPLPRSTKRSSRRVSSQSFDDQQPEPISEDNRYLNLRGLIHHSSPYITLDESRIAAFSPSSKAFPSKTGRSQRDSHLPNTTMHLDLRALNLHLALRAAEILACAESMWEWVLKYQIEANRKRSSRPSVRPFRSASIDTPPRKSFASVSSADSTDSFRDSILELTRDDFDSLLDKFDMDMQDKYSLGACLRDRFSWSVMDSVPTQERKNFETACDKWDKWELEQLAASSTHPYHTSSILSKPDPATTTSHSSSLHFSDNNDRSHGPPIGNDKKRRRASTSSSSTLLPPTRRLSRAMRVFVAWKS
ncbi:hypothetical protein Hypma_000730 [Hypsizygus marmoreus]|uniref:Methyltransferase domain-containing protein n=1 Tax=Hypsizygus marmoreus TaxID=39966 RepID=A0A369JBT9_HYPMA|nr:hypothetical protein Hypma_000730 [Hypsizygus marmoreus]